MENFRLTPNDPLDLARLQSMLEGSSDLSLVWPLARHPFEQEQWREALDPAVGHRSYWIAAASSIVGHAGLRICEQPGERRVSFLFIEPGHRGRGTGRWLMQALEMEALRLGATSLGLTVRAHNARALWLYTASGYQERSRAGNAIDMAKWILPVEGSG